MKRGVSQHRCCRWSLCGALLLSGCALPNSHLPQGFSSTYYRALQGTMVVDPPYQADPTPVLPPPVMPAE